MQNVETLANQHFKLNFLLAFILILLTAFNVSYCRQLQGISITNNVLGSREQNEQMFTVVREERVSIKAFDAGL